MKIYADPDKCGIKERYPAETAERVRRKWPNETAKWEKRGYLSVIIDGVRYPRYRVVAALCIGRKLRSDETVHHINEIKTDDRPSNLYICPWHEHLRIHSKKIMVESNLNVYK